jgi:hypothetical protein
MVVVRGHFLTKPASKIGRASGLLIVLLWIEAYDVIAIVMKMTKLAVVAVMMTTNLFPYIIHLLLYSKPLHLPYPPTAKT